MLNSRAVRSSDMDTKAFPSFENFTCVTLCVCAQLTAVHCPVTMSHNRMVLSAEPLAMYAPEGENVTERTALLWSFNTNKLRVSMFQTWTVASPKADAKSTLSGENARQLTNSRWSPKWRSACGECDISLMLSVPTIPSNSCYVLLIQNSN